MASASDISIIASIAVGFVIAIGVFGGLLYYKHKQQLDHNAQQIAQIQERFNLAEQANLPPFYCDHHLDPICIYEHEQEDHRLAMLAIEEAESIQEQQIMREQEQAYMRMHDHNHYTVAGSNLNNNNNSNSNNHPNSDDGAVGIELQQVSVQSLDNGGQVEFEQHQQLQPEQIGLGITTNPPSTSVSRRASMSDQLGPATCLTNSNNNSNSNSQANSRNASAAPSIASVSTGGVSGAFGSIRAAINRTLTGGNNNNSDNNNSNSNNRLSMLSTSSRHSSNNNNNNNNTMTIPVEFLAPVVDSPAAESAISTPTGGSGLPVDRNGASAATTTTATTTTTTTRTGFPFNNNTSSLFSTPASSPSSTIQSIRSSSSNSPLMTSMTRSRASTLPSRPSLLGSNYVSASDGTRSGMSGLTGSSTMTLSSPTTTTTTSRIARMRAILRPPPVQRLESFSSISSASSSIAGHGNNFYIPADHSNTQQHHYPYHPASSGSPALGSNRVFSTDSLSTVGSTTASGNHNHGSGTEMDFHRNGSVASLILSQPNTLILSPQQQQQSPQQRGTGSPRLWSRHPISPVIIPISSYHATTHHGQDYLDLDEDHRVNASHTLPQPVQVLGLLGQLQRQQQVLQQMQQQQQRNGGSVVTGGDAVQQSPVMSPPPVTGSPVLMQQRQEPEMAHLGLPPAYLPHPPSYDAIAAES